MDIKAIHDLQVTSAVFQHLGYQPYAASKKDMLYAVWDSAILDGGTGLVSWASFSYSLTRNSEYDKVYVYVKTSDSQEMSGEKWSTPFVNEGGSIMSSKRYLAMRIVMRSPVTSAYNYHGTTLGPVVSDMEISSIVSDTAALFFTKTFELGFYPKSIVTTVSADVPEGATLDIGATSLDSITAEDYQFFSPNTIVDLDRLSITGKKIKLMLRMSGSGTSEVVVHEFAAMFSGDDQTRLSM